VPLVLKDNIDTADFPTTAGTPALAANRPKRNATIVQRLLDAGSIVLGKANLQELAWGPTNNNAAFGPARNPYDPTRIPGGSSGGTGAAVAARLAPAGLGTDTGGSIRVPASLSGVVSLRPTTLRWPQAGIVPISHTRDTAGPMARCVADCALIDGVITGGPTEVAAVRLDGLRIGVPRGHFWEGLDDELARIVEPVLAQLRHAGAVLVEGDVADVAALDRAAGFPIALYEFVTDLNEYLTEHETGLDFARVVAQAKSPMVKDALIGLTGAGAISESDYRGARHPSPETAGNLSPLLPGARRRRDDLSNNTIARCQDRRGRHGRAQRHAGTDLGDLHSQSGARKHGRHPRDEPAGRSDQSRASGRHRNRRTRRQRSTGSRDCPCA
jgi:indoleacetamide hydrolase